MQSWLAVGQPGFLFGMGQTPHTMWVVMKKSVWAIPPLRTFKKWDD
jgi:hypothetical protein